MLYFKVSTVAVCLSSSKVSLSSGYKILLRMKTFSIHVAFCLILFLSMFSCQRATTEAVAPNNSQASSTTLAPALETSPASTESTSVTNTQATSPLPIKSEVGCIGKIRRFILNCLKRKIRFIEGLPDLFWEVFCNNNLRNKQVIEAIGVRFKKSCRSCW